MISAIFLFGEFFQPLFHLCFYTSTLYPALHDRYSMISNNADHQPHFYLLINIIDLPYTIKTIHR